MKGTAQNERVLGRYATGRPGPTVIVCGGLHGNELSGVEAARRVLARLEADGLPLRGELIGVAGNLAALEARRRFLDVDLNRCWMQDHIRALRAGDPAKDNAEEREQRALLALLDEAAAAESLVLLDLHATSGESPPFTVMSDTLRNRRIAFALPVPVILGLEESVDGTLLEYLTEAGHTAVVVEGGQRDDPAAIDNHEAVIWIGLVAAGGLARDDVPGFGALARRLRAACRDVPRVVELRHRHEVAAGDGFVMERGFRGLQKIAADELVGRDRGGEIRTVERGRILMPLYQEQGDDGFFLVRRVSRFWLWLSAALRRLRLGAVLPLLPGVRKHPDQPNALRVNPRVARWYVVEIFHLFGFRRRRPEGDHLVFSRRRPG